MRTFLALGLIAGLGAFAATAQAQAPKKIAISTIVEVPALVETKQGVLLALADRGFVEGKTLTVDYQNANGNMPTQQQIAKKFVGDGVAAIVAISTPTAQAMLTATKDIPIVFASVTDPVKGRLIKDYGKSGINVAGVSDAAPLEAQVKLFRELVPNLKKLGFVYNPGLDNAVSTLENLRKIAGPLGVDIVESPAPTTNEVIPAAKKLIGKVEAIYVPNDTTVVAALESIVKIGQETKTPVFTGETGGVERGAVASVGLDYVDVGRAAGQIVADVLEGKPVGQLDSVIAYTKLTNFKVVVNKGSAAAMGVTVPQAVLSRATKVVN
jgi:putative ABC transport system substrate-binding protein